MVSASEGDPGAAGSPRRPLFLKRGQPLTGSKTELVRGLDTFAAASIIMGIVIGAGIFRTPNVVADIAGATGLIFVAFLLAGLLVMLGALCFAELGAMLPKSGGYYVYLQKAYGDMPAFLLGWSAFLMIQGAGMAAVAVFLGELGGILFGYGAGPGLFSIEMGAVVIQSPPFMVSLVAAGSIVLLGLTNVLGVRLAGHVQVSFAVFKISALIAVIVVGIYFGRGEPLALTPMFPTSWNFNTMQIVGLAMIPALFTYSGWVNANTVAEEIQDVEKTLPRAIIMAVTVIIGIYLVTNFAYLWAIGLEGVARSEAGVAADVFTQAFGESLQVGNWSVAPGAIITLIIFVSLFGSLNGMSLAYPRMYYAMAKSGVFFKNAARTHPRYKTPHLAIALQVVWVTVLVFSGTFERLLEFVVFSSFVFFTLTVIALIVLRIKRPDLPRPFKVPFYPVVPVVFILGSSAVLINQIVGSPVNAGIALVLIVLGIPVFYLWRRFGTGPVEDASDSGGPRSPKIPGVRGSPKRLDPSGGVRRFAATLITQNSSCCPVALMERINLKGTGVASILMFSLVLAGCLGDDVDEPADSQDLTGEAMEGGFWHRPLPNVIDGLSHVTEIEDVAAGAGIATHGDYLYVAGLGTGFYIVDVTTPEDPQVVGHVPDQWARGVDLIHYDDGSIVAALAGESRGLIFYNVTDPTQPQYLATELEDVAVHNVQVLPGTALVYNSRSLDLPGVDIVDASDPRDPFVAAVVRDELTCHDIRFWAEGDRAYCPGVRETQIWDISDPLDPQVVSTIVNPAIQIHHWAMPVQNGSLLVIGDEFAGSTDAAAGCFAAQDTPLGTISDPVGAVWFYDLSNEAVPVPVGYLAPPLPVNNLPPAPCTAHFGEQVGDRDMMIVGWRTAGTSLIDFSDPSAPVLVDQLATTGDIWEAHYHGGYVFTGDRWGHAEVLTFTGD